MQWLYIYSITCNKYTAMYTNKKALGLKAQPLKGFILGRSPSGNRKWLKHILPNVNIHPPTQNF